MMSGSILNQWRPLQGIPTYGKFPTAGEIIAHDYGAWRVVDVIESDEHTDVLIRPADRGEGIGTRGGRFPKGHRPRFTLLPEHYAICRECGDVPPCRHEMGIRVAKHVTEEQARYELPGVCPSCSEPVTAKQKSVTMPNVIVPLGIEVTFHLRQRCRSAAAYYEERVVAQTGDPLKLSCKGHLIGHRDGTKECRSADCPDPNVIHRGNYSACYALSAGCPRFECEFGPLSEEPKTEGTTKT